MLAWIPGVWELLLLVLVLLLLFSNRLPVLARSVGQSILEFRHSVKGIRDRSAESGPDQRES